MPQLSLINNFSENYVEFSKVEKTMKRLNKNSAL